MKQTDWVTWKEPIYKFTLFGKGFIKTGEKTKKRRKTLMERVMEATNNYYQNRVEDWIFDNSFYSYGIPKHTHKKSIFKRIKRYFKD